MQLTDSKKRLRKKVSSSTTKNPSISAPVPVITSDEITMGTQKLGEGSFGAVWKGKCRGNIVAIKILLQFDKKREKEFQQEVEIMARVTHPNIMGLLGACTECVNPADLNGPRVTQFMDKGDLHDILHQNRAEIPLLRKIKFALDIASGMAWLQGKDVEIIHNDLKPQNCLVDSSWTVKIADFGLSRLKAKGVTVVERGKGVGSPYYMSPEALQEHYQVDKSTDVYSYAIVLWEILTREIPLFHHEPTPMPEYIQAIAGGERPTLAKLESVPQFVPLLTKCWDKIQRNRPTFVEIIEDLHKIRADIFLRGYCPQAYKIWLRFWASCESVYYGDVISAIIDPINLEAEDSKSEDKIFDILVELFGEEDEISIEQFSKLLIWFGPLCTEKKPQNLLKNMLSLHKEPWFFGNMEKQHSESHCKYYARDGLFLVRFNLGGNSKVQDYPFTITRCKGPSVEHLRVSLLGNGSFLAKIAGKEYQGATLPELVANANAVLNKCPPKIKEDNDPSAPNSYQIPQ